MNTNELINTLEVLPTQSWERFRSEIIQSLYKLKGLELFKRSVDAALNSGDGSYRP